MDGLAFIRAEHAVAVSETLFDEFLQGSFLHMLPWFNRMHLQHKLRVTGKVDLLSDPFPAAIGADYRQRHHTCILTLPEMYHHVSEHFA